MQYRLALFFVVAVGIIATAQCASLVVSTSPFDAPSAVLWNVFLSAFFSLSCSIGTVVYLIRRRGGKASGTAVLFRSVRQAALGSAVVLLALFFNATDILQPWEVAPLILAAILIEFFFQAEKRPHASIRYE